MSEAGKVFDSQGYHTANLGAVAAAAGLKKPTLYHYFASKDEILFAIHEEFIDLLIAKHQARNGLAATENLREIIADVLRLMETHRGHVRVFFENHRELASTHRATIGAKRDHYAALVQAEIERGIRDGTFRPVDARLAMLALFGMCNWAYQWYQASGKLSNEEVAQFFWDLLIRGLQRRDEDT